MLTSCLIHQTDKKMKLINFQDRWIPREHIDIPLTKEQFGALCNGFDPGWEARYSTMALGGGWFYVYRSGFLLEKFRYEKGAGGLYHLVEFFYKKNAYNPTAPLSPDALSYFVGYAMYEGDYQPSLRDLAVQYIQIIKKGEL